jgi:endo-1,4-beta-mannosidase
MNLKLDVTFFTGHMSGPNWAPHWMLHGHKPISGRQVVCGSKIVKNGYLNPYSNEIVIAAEKLQIQTVVNLLKEHPAIGVWNLGNEPDIFARPKNERVGENWDGDLVSIVHEIDPNHPVTCGLHIASLLYNNGLRVDQVFSKTDFAVMHAYPMYDKFLTRNPLDPDYVPFTCALTAALSGKPVLMEEFGGCTAPPGQASFTWKWTGYGRKFKQFMAAEEALAEYYRLVLPKLVEVRAFGALVWCFADYHNRLWDRPPCSESWHERFFGIIRQDGSLKPHANVIKEFASTHPAVKPAKKVIYLPYSSSKYYQYTPVRLMHLYKDWNAKIIRSQNQ